MSILDVRKLLGGLRSRAAGQEELAVLDAVVRTLDRFADAMPEELIASLDKLKPKKSTTRATTKTTVPASALVGTYVAELRNVLGDPAAMSEVMRRLRADKAVKKGEAIAIAQGVGVRVTSKTPKAQALTQIEGLSSQMGRDRVTAERIRRGA